LYPGKSSLPNSACSSTPLGGSRLIPNRQISRGVRPNRQALDLKPGSQPARITLVPVASIAGMVLDENSEPVEGVVVQSIAVKSGELFHRPVLLVRKKPILECPHRPTDGQPDSEWAPT
jgi:hypothetical protein